MINRIFKFLKKNIGLFLLIFVLINFDSVSLADANTQAAIGGMTGTLSLFLKFFQILLYPILFLIGALMDNSLLFGPGAEDRLLEIWSYVRNLINLLLGVGLVAIAIYNIAGLDADGNYAIKTVLPKIGLALVLINFSYVGSKIILDVTNVLTTTAFSLPNTVMGTQNNVDLGGICKGMNEALSSTPIAASSSSGALSSKVQELCGTDGNNPTEKFKAFLNGTTSNNLAFIMATNFGLINQASNVNNLVISVPSLMNLGINAIVSTILLGANFIVYLMLLLVVVGRFVILYILISVSPLVVLSMVMSGSLPESVSSLLNNLFDDFLNNATAPIIIGLGLSVSYMMFDAMVKIGNVNTLAIASDFQAVFPSGVDIHQFIIGIASAYVVYKAADTATNNTIVSETVRPLKNFATDRASDLKNLPTTIPFLRTPDGKAMNMQQGLNSISDKVREAAGVKSSTTSDKSELRKFVEGNRGPKAIEGLGVPELKQILRDGSSKSKEANQNFLKQLIVKDPTGTAMYKPLLDAINEGEEGDTLQKHMESLTDTQKSALAKELEFNIEEIGSPKYRLR
jgi:hypothetical protein